MKIKWNPTGRRMALSLYLGLIAFVLAQGINAFVAEALYQPLSAALLPVAAPTATIPNSGERSKQFVDEILRSGVFPVPAALANPETAGSSLPSAPPLDVDKKVSLLGTVMSNRQSSIAILEDRTKKTQQLYHLRESVANVGELAEIQKDRVLFRLGKQEEWLQLELTKAQPVTVPVRLTPVRSPINKPSARQVIDRRELTTVSSDSTLLFSHAQPVPLFADGRFQGFRLDAVNFYGFYGKIGLESGDVLLRINGTEIRDPGTLVSVIQRLKDEPSVKLDILRHEQPYTLAYEIR